MRFSIKELATTYRARFQLTSRCWDQLVALGQIYQTPAVYRMRPGGKTTKKPQGWFLLSGRREFQVFNLGHGWYQISIARQLVDPVMDRQQRAILSMTKLALNPEPVGQLTEDMLGKEITYGLIRQRDPQQIKQGLTPTGRTPVKYDPPQHRLPSAQPRHKPAFVPPPVSADKLAHLQARFNRK